MPSPRYITEPEQPNSLGGLLSGFLDKANKSNQEDRESDALASIYEQSKQDGWNLEQTLRAVQTDKRMGPTQKVNTANQLMNFQKINQEDQKLAQKRLEEENKSLRSKAIRKDLEGKRGLEPGSLDAYGDDVNLAERLTRPAKEGKRTESSQPIDPDQLKNIKAVREMPEYEKASPAKKYQMLTDNNVSVRNAEAEAKIYAAENESNTLRTNTIAKAQAQNDVDFVNEQISKLPMLSQKQQVLDEASVLNAEGVTGKNWDIAMQKLGLLQYTSEGYRVFSSLAKDAVKNSNIKATIGSQISQMEFGFFRDATINPNFRKEANEQIIKKEGLAIRYEKLYADITAKILKENKDQIPERIQHLVNEEFSKQAEKISKEVKKAATNFNAIQNVPKGHTLMFDKNRNPIHVPNDQVKKASEPPFGATLS